MSGARSGPTNAFRPTRTTRSTAAATTASTTTNPTRPSTSRPPSVASNGRPGSSTGVRPPSRPSSVAGFTSGATRPSAAAATRTSRTSAPAASSGTAGVKRKTRAGSTGAEQEPAAPKRPALSSAFSAHVTQTSLNRQLLAAQTQVTELQNSLLEKQREVDRLEADLRLVGTREEEEREARKHAEEELTQKTGAYESELSSLKRKFAELESHHEDLDDAYSTLSHTSQSKIATLNVEVTTRDERIALLESQLKDTQARAREGEIRAKALEEVLEQMTEEEPETEGEEQEERKREVGHEMDEQPKMDTSLRLEIQEPESSVDDGCSSRAEKDEDDEYLGADQEEDASMAVDAEGDITPTGEIEISSIHSVEPNTFYEGGHPGPEIKSHPDAGAPPTYTVSSPNSPSASTSASAASRSRSASVASSHCASIASSRAMSLTLDGPPPQVTYGSPSGTPLSITPSSRLDPLSHIRQRLSLATPSRRRRRRHSSLVSSHSQERSKDSEIIRTELARQTSHITSLEATNTRLTSEVTRLRTRAEGAEVLREEKRELERRLESMESLRTRVAELETTATESARREREWEARLKERVRGGDENSTPAKTPVGVTQQLTTLRKAHSALLDEHGQLKANLRACEVELAGAREEAENVSADCVRLKTEMEHLQDTVARKEKERVLLERDATFLRSLVSSYKNEEAANTSSDIGEHAAVTEKLEQRILQLETLLSEYKSTIGSLEEVVEKLQRSGGGMANRSQEQWAQLSGRASTLEEAFKNAQAEVTRQAKLVDDLEQRLFELGGEIGSGRHIPPGTRVLSFRQNPAQEWADTRKEVLDGLKTENEALLERLKDLEVQLPLTSSIPSTSTDTNAVASDEKAHSVPRASWEVLKHENASQASLLAQKEKRLLRLQQVYSAKSTEFREAIEAILGVKLAFYPNGQVRVTSIYDLSAAFVFQPAKDIKDMDDKNGAKMQLIALGDGGPQELQGLMNTWIRDEMSIPCFMSSVTLECYDKRQSEQRAAAAAGLG